MVIIFFDDLDRCLTFYQFHEQHWSHLRTSNPVESPFAGVRLRTNAAKRFKKTGSGKLRRQQAMRQHLFEKKPSTRTRRHRIDRPGDTRR